jgi:hypothetical protein
LSEAEIELRAKTTPQLLVETLALIEKDIAALPKSTREERDGLALSAWVGALTAEANFRIAVSADAARETKKQLLRDAEKRFRAAKAFVDQYPELIDANSSEMNELVRTGAERSSAELAKLR